MKIFGAGMAGLIAGMYNPKAVIYERSKKPQQNHHALLRFRTDEVSKITGVKFKKIKVAKSIWYEGEERRPSPMLIAKYSKKNTGCYENRSIMDIETCVRYIAPDNFYNILVEGLSDRIHFGYEIKRRDFLDNDDIISTLPLYVNAGMLGLNGIKTEHNTSEIFVNVFEIQNCDMYTTVYYPSNGLSIYRASITGNKLIIESKEKLDNENGYIDSSLKVVFESTGIDSIYANQIIKNHIQPMGKLSGINDSERRMLIYKMSHDHRVFSLGRFALHKNILLDDVAKDVQVINSMMNDDTYGVSIRDRT